ncbi:uncharacterized Golgi apparatus membrane protein-like protein CG5021 isoform X1 [Pieris brassicae]|uniref:Golgi apparatus membrane protein TVP23 homolog n=1 Tax=Pieris brassicae TaxID=7116 RepID=A0A9P0TN81_PIEBR|nr:uncharacterized Golgi apparatus membrane protein-like protein CG5021 isoform X1 [Pieris brassicae]CAH4033013.1 unnamed protein product [Pieris brassicae]
MNSNSATPGVPQVPLLDDDTIAFGEEDNANKQFVHPYIVFFHLVFRCSAIVVYILCGWFSDSFIASFVLVTLLLSADFWTVKNISGRLLVGLRWWNYVDDEGKSHWVFESKQNRVNGNESRLFWLGLTLCPLIWSGFFIISLLSFKFRWMLLVMIALTLTGANLYGYVKCKFGAKENLKSVTTDFVKKQFLANATSFMFAQPAPPNVNTNTGVV